MQQNQRVCLIMPFCLFWKRLRVKIFSLAFLLVFPRFPMTTMNTVPNTVALFYMHCPIEIMQDKSWLPKSDALQFCLMALFMIKSSSCIRHFLLAPVSFLKLWHWTKCHKLSIRNCYLFLFRYSSCLVSLDLFRIVMAMLFEPSFWIA